MPSDAGSSVAWPILVDDVHVVFENDVQRGAPGVAQ